MPTPLQKSIDEAIALLRALRDHSICSEPCIDSGDPGDMLALHQLAAMSACAADHVLLRVAQAAGLTHQGLGGDYSNVCFNAVYDNMLVTIKARVSDIEHEQRVDPNREHSTLDHRTQGIAA